MTYEQKSDTCFLHPEFNLDSECLIGFELTKQKSRPFWNIGEDIWKPFLNFGQVHG